MGRARRGSAVAKRVSLTIPARVVEAPRRLVDMGVLPEGVSAKRSYEHLLAVGWDKIESDVRERIELEAYAAAASQEPSRLDEVKELFELARKAGIA